MTAPLIRADFLLLAIRGELGEQRFVRKIRESKLDTDDAELARIDGFIEALEWAESQVTARAKKVAA